VIRCLLLALLCASIIQALITQARAEEKTLRAVMNIELQILDPQVSTATVTRALGYMVYDTLIAMDSAGVYHPQMLEGWTASDDHLTWTFTLRPGLTFHDGAPVTAEDCVASLRRWARMDAFGKRLMDAAQDLTVVDTKTFVLRLKRPFAFVIEALGKPNAFVPFILPARIVASATARPITEAIGSGPFTFDKAAWVPGDKAVFHKFTAYQPRPEKPDGFAGGKVAYFDRVEFLRMPDPATRIAALQTGSVDYLEVLPFDFVDLMRHDPHITVMAPPPAAQIMGGLSVNNILPPFNDVRIRKALQIALDQSEIMAGTGLPEDMYLPFCQDVFLCGGPYATDVGTEALRHPGPEKARQLLKEAGYNGERIVLLHSTDSALINPISLVVIEQIKRAGFNLDVAAGDYSSLAQRRMKKDPLEQGGWNLMPVVWSGYDMINPLSHYATAYSCTGQYVGWNCDPGMPPLVAAFEQESDPANRMALAKEMQLRVLDQAPQMFLGQFSPPSAYRSDLHGVLPTGLHVFWNVRRE
jgi:peptide/nickel transport system substrate-binding protein